MSISSTASIERCGPPEWSGTVHTHVALYTDAAVHQRFSAQDRGVMRQWYERWHADGVFCLIYSARDAHCEADGVVGGLRSRPRHGALSPARGHAQENGRRAKRDLGRSLQSLSSSPQVRPARAKKNAIIKVEQHDVKSLLPG